MPERLQAFGLVGECWLCPGLAVDGGVHLVAPCIDGRVIGEQGGYVYPAHLAQQLAQMLSNTIWLDPAVIRSGLTAQVVDDVRPRMHPRRQVQAQFHWSRIKFCQLSELCIDCEVRTAWAVA